MYCARARNGRGVGATAPGLTGIVPETSVAEQGSAHLNQNMAVDVEVKNPSRWSMLASLSSLKFKNNMRRRQTQLLQTYTQLVSSSANQLGAYRRLLE